MDAHSLLTSQGWRGTGHSLHPTSDMTGLSRPLLVSQKANNLGVGKKQHKTSDMWWMNAFDKSLQGLDTSEQGKVVQTITSGGLDMVVKGGGKWVGSAGGLYASFVRGEGLGGTITPESQVESGEEVLRKKRRTVGDNKGKETKEERRARKAAKRVTRIQESASEETSGVEEKIETKEKRRARRAAEKSLKKQDSTVDEEPESMEVDGTTEKVETKEERKERKRQKKLLKEAEQKALEEVASSKAQKMKRRKV